MAKVLLADDSATMQKVVDVVLREEGYEVQSANTGEEALQAVGSSAPDLVLAYIKLPGINGYELTKQIKSSAGIPVVLLAGAFEPVDEALMQDCGADDTLVKPFQTEDLLAKIRQYLPESGAPAVAEAEDDIVFDMSGEDEPEPDVVPEVMTGGGGGDPFGGGGGFDAAPVEAEPVEAMVEADVVEAGVVEADVYEAEPVEAMVEADVVEAGVVEAGVVEAGVVEADVYEAEPVVSAAPAAPVAPIASMPQANIPSSEELSAIFLKTVEENVVLALKGSDIREAIVALLEPHIKETVSTMLMEAMPQLLQKVLEELVGGSLATLNTELENIMWETVPELAETLIKKEIEKIKAES